MKLSELLEQAQNNYYKMLTVIDNNHNADKLINTLTPKGWNAYDVTAEVIKMLEGLPEAKRKVRIGIKIKEWFLSLPDKIILYNTSFLYSPELGRLNPIGAFKYKSRNKEIIVIMEGQVSGNRLQYSEYGRPDHCDIDISEVIHVRLEDIEIDL